MKRRVLCLLLMLCIAFSPLCPQAAADTEVRDLGRETALASSLKAMGLFRGVSDTDFDLNRAPTRAEALVMLLRLLGLEGAALSENAAHPFTDTVSQHWADPYIGYGYVHGLTKGLSDESFGGAGAADAKTFLTFVLRALGYAEGPEGDFSWDAPLPLAKSLGLLPDRLRLSSFLRADAVSVAYAALAAPCKGGGETLGQRLARQSVISAGALETFYDPEAADSGVLNETVSKNVARFMRPFVTNGGIDISGLTPRYYGGTLMQLGDAGYELYGFYAQGAADCAAQVKAAADALAGKARVFGIIAPNSMGALLSKADFSRLCKSSKSELEGIDYSYGQMGDGVFTVDAASNLRLHSDEYTYFRTDHHWTALGAYYAYEAWAETAGLSPLGLDSFSRLDMPGHLGLFYSMCGSPSVMKQNPDTVTAFLPDSVLSVEILDKNGVSAGQLIYDCTNAAYKYSAFLGGDHPLTAITNSDIDDDSACVLVKDSYGNPFAVYMTQHYHTVYVVDYRYYKDTAGYLTFSQFAAQKGVTDFIILLPMTLSQSPYTATCLSRYCK